MRKGVKPVHEGVMAMLCSPDDKNIPLGIELAVQQNEAVEVLHLCQFAYFDRVWKRELCCELTDRIYAVLEVDKIINEHIHEGTYPYHLTYNIKDAFHYIFKEIRAKNIWEVSQDAGMMLMGHDPATGHTAVVRTRHSGRNVAKNTYYHLKSIREFRRKGYINIKRYKLCFEGSAYQDINIPDDFLKTEAEEFTIYSNCYPFALRVNPIEFHVETKAIEIDSTNIVMLDEFRELPNLKVLIVKAEDKMIDPVSHFKAIAKLPSLKFLHIDWNFDSKHIKHLMPLFEKGIDVNLLN